MNLFADFSMGVREVGLAIRRPEELATRWRDREVKPEAAPVASVFTVLLMTAYEALSPKSAWIQRNPICFRKSSKSSVAE